MKPRLLILILIAIGITTVPLPAAESTSVSTPDEALKRLMDGNARYVGGKAIHPDQDAERRAAVSKGQHPFATVLSCADSRVPVEVLFDQGIGDTFVVRVAGNVSDTDEVGTIEYGVGHLNTPLLVILGHTGCGAVKAVVEGAEVHGSIPALVDNIGPAVARAKAANPNLSGTALLNEAVKANVWISIDDLFKRSSEVRELVEAGKIKVVGAVYNLESGEVNWLGQHPEQSRLLAYKEGAGHGDDSAEGKENSHETASTAAEAHGNTDALTATASTSVNLKPRTWSWIFGTVIAVAILLAGAWAFARTGMNRLKVPQRMVVGFSMILIVLGVVGFAGYRGLHEARSDFVEYRSDARHSVLAGRIQANFLEMRIAAKDYQMNRSVADVQQYEERRGKVLGFLDDARKTIVEAERKQMLETIAAQLESHYTLFQQMGKTSGAAAIAEIGKRMAVVGTTLDHEVEKLKLEFVADQNHLGPIATRDMQEAQASIICIAMGTFVLGIFLAWLISGSIVTPLRGITETLRAGAEQTASAACQVSSSAQSLAEGASEQAASIEETSASIEELSSITKRNAENAQKANELARQARVAADTGASDMQAMNQAMEAIKVSSDDIAKIIKTIDEIAFQTNILALNAAVEAARAGEAGMGFAVVADEVRNLAQRCAQSAKETSGKIEGAITRTSQGVELSTKVAKGLQDILLKAREVDELAAEVAHASNEQSTGIGQVSKAVGQMDKVTQSNAASAEESAAAAEEMNSQAAVLKDAVADLLQMIGGSKNSNATTAANTAGPKGRAVHPKTVDNSHAAFTRRIKPEAVEA